ncbi:hydroxyacylglutathione hydrolase [Brevundimonas lutea]|uniref:hydroxyacylglutathione hydrolase n=1 Tax=Brevundimonas lutea TaxID=2293980 RepID=UPI000F02527E|nr:hydroxyacylglutathione hydrolase [Brevundimonas lutea]
MTLDVRLFPCLSDNYGILIRDQTSGVVAAIDTPEVEPYRAEIAASGWNRLDLILNTHWHPDHTQGNAALKAEFGAMVVAPEEVTRVGEVDRIVGDGDVVEVGETQLEVTVTPGHTLGHIVYRDAAGGQAFVGDTLFPLGCGRLFEGTAEQMFDSLARLKAWPDDTVLWCAHEYAVANARFALSLDDDPALTGHAETIFSARREDRPTVPTTLAIERRFNPFLTAPDAAEFARRRAAKDGFKG